MIGQRNEEEEEMKRKNEKESSPGLDDGITLKTDIERAEIVIKVIADKNRNGCTCYHHSIYHLTTDDILKI